MKKYIVVKHNLMRNQKFYKIHKTADSWSIEKEQAYKYRFRFVAEKIAKDKTKTMPESLRNFIVEYRVEEIEV